ncbi:hypothetical protein [Marinobacter shengliensis]|uniref:hypothetical protein n=1 Tax=Marinobacter shengliensis TaxID=1389223 RepID=UPI0011088970|nr:hypothetical protein [Marinobacter shengliensis]
MNAIDLSSLSNATPPLNAIDLSALGESVNAAVLDLAASGAGTVINVGAGSAQISLLAAGVGLWIDAGAGTAELTFSAAGSAGGGYRGEGAAELSLSVSGSGYQDWLAALPPVQLQEVYRLVITGSADGLADFYIGGISSWQATNQAGGRSSYLQAVIPAADQVVADIEARQNGQLIIQKGYRLESGEVRYEEVLRSRFDTLRPDRGQRALTVTVSGYLRRDTVFGGQRSLTGIRSISAPNGKRRARCDVDLFLRPGMTVEALGETFRADYINYYVSDTDKFCEVAER